MNYTQHSNPPPLDLLLPSNSSSHRLVEIFYKIRNSLFILLLDHGSQVNANMPYPRLGRLLVAVAAITTFAIGGVEADRQSPLARGSSAGCKCFPGDSCWPGPSEWASFNRTVDGRLAATVPLASPCHDPNYDGDKCAELRDQWLFSTVQ